MKVYLVCNARLENLYIQEFVEHYLNLNFDKIIIYDNNDKTGEKISNVIQNDKVEIIEDYRGKGREINGVWYQTLIYTEAYKKYSDECDWICFFDVDEFLTLDEKYNNDIKKFLSEEFFEKFESIKLVWKIFDDNNLVHYEKQPVTKRFNKLSKCQDNQIKTILRTKLNISELTCHGTTDIYVKKCNSEGNECIYIKDEKIGNYINNPSYQNAYLSHYRLKTIEEYMHKCSQGSSTYKRTLEYFFEYNDKTKDKLDYLHSIGINYE